MSENNHSHNAANDLRLRLRQERAVRQQSRWVKSFQVATGCKIDEHAPLPFPSAVKLHDLFFARLKDGVGVVTKEVRANERNVLVAQLARRIPLLPKQDAFLLFGDEPIAVRLELDLILRMADRLWNFVKDEIALATEDATAGLCIEITYYDNSGRYAKEGFCSASAWGIFTVLLEV
jgi:hypothetical protein